MVKYILIDGYSIAKKYTSECLFMNIKRIIKMTFLRMKFRKNNVIFGKKTNIAKNSTFEGYNVIGSGCTFEGHIGYASYLGNSCHITAKIGKYCSIAPYVSIIRGKHPSRNWLSTHPAFFSTLKQCGMTYVTENKFDEFSNITEIGNDVWIGQSATIIDGVKIGDGAIIGTGSMVTKDIPPYAIAVGVPAKVIRYRFTEEQIAKLLELKWWDKSEEWIKENADKFEHIDNFIK